MKVRNIKKIIIEGSNMKIYVKKPLFKNTLQFLEELDDTFKETNEWESYLGTGMKGKYFVLTFVLRNKDDIEPYIKYGMGKDILKIIYENLNEIQYMLKWTTAKKKIRRKVKEIMASIDKLKEGE